MIRWIKKNKIIFNQQKISDPDHKINLFNICLIIILWSIKHDQNSLYLKVSIL